MSDEYPRDDELNKIENWNWEAGFKSLIEFIQNLWWQPDWGFNLREGRDHIFRKKCMKLELHTGGWSGNEDIINSLKRNYMFWSMCWRKSMAGGHYGFEISMDLWDKR